MSGYAKEDWWMPWQLAMVEDRSRKWREQTFSPSDAIECPSGSGTVMRQKQPDESEVAGGRVVSGGWEHEHCSLCMATISLHPDHEHSGYTDRKDWLCKTCYQKFVVPRLAQT